MGCGNNRAEYGQGWEFLKANFAAGYVTNQLEMVLEQTAFGSFDGAR